MLVVVELRGIERFETGRQNHRTHIEGERLGFIVEQNGPGGTKFFTGLAFALLQVDTLFRIDGVFQRYGLGIGNVDGFSLGQSLVVFVRLFCRAFLGTGTAGDALFHVDVSGLSGHRYVKIALLTFDIRHFGKGMKLNVDVPADLDQFG